MSDTIIDTLSDAAAKIPIDESGLLALDWMNGRRTPDANQMLKGAITGINLGQRCAKNLSRPCRGDRIRCEENCRSVQVSEGVRIDGVIAFGGVAKKSKFIMQIVCDVLDMSIKIPRSEQTCALGAAMCAATVAGVYPTIEAAKNHMGNGFEREFKPRPENAAKYRALYERYSRLGEFIENEIMSGKKSL